MLPFAACTGQVPASLPLPFSRFFSVADPGTKTPAPLSIFLFVKGTVLPDPHVGTYTPQAGPPPGAWEGVSGPSWLEFPH